MRQDATQPRASLVGSRVALLTDRLPGRLATNMTSGAVMSRTNSLASPHISSTASTCVDTSPSTRRSSTSSLALARTRADTPLESMKVTRERSTTTWCTPVPATASIALTSCGLVAMSNSPPATTCASSSMRTSKTRMSTYFRRTTK